MTDLDLLERITCDPQVLAGKPVIRGTRLSVEFILNLLAHGTTDEEIMAENPGVNAADVRACLLFASNSMANTAFMPLAER